MWVVFFASHTHIYIYIVLLLLKYICVCMCECVFILLGYNKIILARSMSVAKAMLL